MLSNNDLKSRKRFAIIIGIVLFILAAVVFGYYLRNEDKPQSNNVTLTAVQFTGNFSNESIDTNGDGLAVQFTGNFSNESIDTNGDGLAVQFTGNFSNESIDTNGDGLNDILRIEAEINVNKGGEFYFSTTLNAKDSTMITFVSKDIVLETGKSTLFFDFDGLDIRESDIDGPYSVLILRFNPYGDVIDAREFITADYKSSAFKIRDAAFTDQYSISREDLNNDTKYDSLIFNIGVNINVSGNYIIEGGLYDKNGDIIDNVYDNVYLEKSNREVQLKYPGWRINSGKINGPYFLRYLAITKESLIDFRLDATSTPIYKYTDFQSY